MTSPRDRFHSLQSDLESARDELESFKGSTRWIESSDTNLNDVLDSSILDTVASDDDENERSIPDCIRDELLDLFDWYTDQHPRRRKIPFGRIVCEYGDDHDRVRPVFEAVADRLDTFEERIDDIKGRQQSLLDDIEIRTCDDPTDFETYKAWAYPMGRAKHASPMAAFQALYLNSNGVEADVDPRSSPAHRRYYAVRTYHHPDDQVMVDRIEECRDHEAWMHFYLEHVHVGQDPTKKSGHIFQGPSTGCRLALLEEHPDFEESDAKIRPRELQDAPTERLKREFRENRSYPTYSELDGDVWFLRNPREVASDSIGEYASFP